jgi:hypothetical protein
MRLVATTPDVPRQRPRDVPASLRFVECRSRSTAAGCEAEGHGGAREEVSKAEGRRTDDAAFVSDGDAAEQWSDARAGERRRASSASPSPRHGSVRARPCSASARAAGHRERDTSLLFFFVVSTRGARSRTDRDHARS